MPYICRAFKSIKTYLIILGKLRQQMVGESMLFGLYKNIRNRKQNEQ